jgi:Protein of unknown function (DUF2851)
MLAELVRLSLVGLPMGVQSGSTQSSSSSDSVSETLVTNLSLPIAEIAISKAWHARAIPDELVTTDGRPVRVIHRGTWTHGLGPDFRDAMIEFDGRSLVTGSVEAHLGTTGWHEHGHDADPRYNDVILHIVLRHSGTNARRLDGAIVPTVVVPEDLVRRFATPEVDWSRFGGATCAEQHALDSPASIRQIIWRLGDIRLSAKSARLEARLSATEPAEILYQEIWDGLGFSSNREPMRLVATTVPLAAIERALTALDREDRLAVCRGLLFGVAGFLPLSPADSRAADLSPSNVAAAEDAWRSLGSPWQGEPISPMAWTTARVRPANHPLSRLATGAALIANAFGGLAPVLLDALRSGQNPDLTLQALSRSPAGLLLGEDRARAIVANGLIPFALALAEQTGDVQLSEAASLAWEHLPGAGHNEVTKRALNQVAGSARISGLGARGEQGLIQLDSALCAPRRCRECPIAHLVVSSLAAPELFLGAANES